MGQRDIESGFLVLAEVAPIGIFVCDREGGYCYSNPQWRRMTGWPRGSALEPTWLESVHPADRAAAAAAWSALTSSGKPLELAVRLLPSGPETIWADLRVRQHPGDAARFLGFASDVTRHKQDEEAILERERFLSAVFENIPLMVFVKDAEELRFVRFNRAAEAQLGISREEMYGKNDFDFFSEEQARFFTGKDREVLRNKSLVDIPEEPIQTRDRGERKLHTKKIPILDDMGEPRYLLGISEDITERHDAEEALRRAKEAADEASRAKSAFLANMSHEIRTPLNAILGFTQTLQLEPDLMNKHREPLEAIMTSGEHLLSLINDVLELSKIEAGRLVLRRSAFDLHAMLDSVAAMFRSRVEAKGLRFSIARSAGVPRHVVGDQDRIRQVLVNFLGNALKFTREGGIEVQADVTEARSATATLSILVQDTGIGIPEQDLERVFRPFEQTVDGSRLGGTGLGLALSRQCAELMGGSIGVESEPGEGSTFRLDVPVGLASASDASRSGGVLARRVALAEGHPAMRILIVDDQPLNREVLRAFLEPVRGIELEEAEGGEEAVRLCREWRPQLVFMDLRMEGLSGLDATRRLKADSATAAIPVIAVTAGAFEEERTEAIDAGADDFLRKPFSRANILEMLVRHLNAKFTPDASAPG